MFSVVKHAIQNSLYTLDSSLSNIKTIYVNCTLGSTISQSLTVLSGPLFPISYNLINSTCNSINNSECMQNHLNDNNFTKSKDTILLYFQMMFSPVELFIKLAKNN